MTKAIVSSRPCKAISSLLHISAGLELCFDQRDDGAGVLVQLRVRETPHSTAFQSPGVAAGCGVRQPLLFHS